ncbi:ABC transporter F family member 4 [Eurytemora carolleeae]|uniref:ABC transporter F family member 4 n=1 Tax=Eurytemora carolleeae TaxID=1294199 RepID=UPI000C7625FD|nr:ABC transporter F family member 4 [Eurytemora carolleeae]|eukprot:XP_023330238.1 ABC transporter F family member 4-like [Eurytemora affinis]
MVDLDGQEDPTESSHSKKKRYENNEEKIEEEDEEETEEPTKKMGRKKKTSKEEPGTESEKVATKSKGGRKKKEAVDNSENDEDLGEKSSNNQNSEKSPRGEQIDAPEYDIEEEAQIAVEEPGIDLDLDKSEDVSKVEGENMSDNLDNSLFKMHKKSAGKNSFSPQKTLNGTRLRIKSKSDKEFDVREFLKLKSFLLCGCNYFSDDGDEQFTCDCHATIQFNEKLTGKVTNLYKTPDESEDFLPMFKPGKSSWDKKSPNHVTLQMYTSEHPGVKGLKGEIRIRGEKQIEMHKRRKVLFVYITAEMDLTLTCSVKVLKKINYRSNPVKYKNLTVDLIYKESVDQRNREGEKSPEHFKKEEDTENDEEENAEAPDSKDACSKKDSEDEEENEENVENKEDEEGEEDEEDEEVENEE